MTELTMANVQEWMPAPAWVEEDGPALHCATMAPALTTWKQLVAQMPRVTWLWPGWLPQGCLVMLVAEPGTGKSALLMRLARTVALGDPWPDGTPAPATRGKVLWVEAESAQVINFDRAQAWGGDPLLNALVHPWPEPFTDTLLDDPVQLAHIRELAAHPEIRLIVVDSLRGAHEGNENESQAAGVLKHLAAIAQLQRLPIIITHHLKKPESHESREVTLNRVRGSSAIVQYPRVIWALDVPDGANQGWKRLHVIKNNLGEAPTPLGFRIGDQGITLTQGAPCATRSTKQEDAKTFLCEQLREGPVPVTTLQARAQEVGIAWRTIERVRQELPIFVDKTATHWVWSLA